jgi:hypothetical protein
MSEPFDFKVTHVLDDDEQPTDEWSVRLPHQCEPWDIAGGYYKGVPHADAVAEVERFIAEAQSALAALVERREVSA